LHCKFAYGDFCLESEHAKQIHNGKLCDLAINLKSLNVIGNTEAEAIKTV